MRRTAPRPIAAATLGFCAGALLLAQTPQQPSVFRSSTNLVTVDAYPRRDGHIVEGLMPSDFDVLEDGVLQKVDQFEFVRIEPTPEAERRDPNNQREMLQLAADPHNRVFVTYLDIDHVTVTGSHDIHGPLVDMLNRIVAPNDLFGVTTSKLPPSALTLGRKLLSVEEQLSRYWTWGERQKSSRDPSDPGETFIDRCFPSSSRCDLPGSMCASDDGAGRPLPDILVDRRREDATLHNLKDLVTYVGTLREARSVLIAITDGWRLFRPDQTLTNYAGASGPPPIGVSPGGRFGMNPANGTVSQSTCNAELNRLAMIDDQQLFRDIIAIANRANVVFYPVNPGGLDVFDTALNQSPIPLEKDTGWHNDRVESAITLALNTDGIAVVNTNDLRGGLAKVVNDVSAYYLLGYYSTNSKADGRYRQIKVRVKRQNVEVVARRGYVATSAASIARAAAAAPASAAPVAADVTSALGTLSRLEGNAGLFAYGAVSGTDLIVVAEIASGQVEMGKWSDGATVKVVVAGPAGENAGTATGRLDAGARGALVRVPIGAVAGPWRVGVTMTGSAGTLDERFDVPPSAGQLLADPIVYRGAPGARAVLRPVADFLFHRTERVHVECPALKPIEQRTARVLDQRGKPLPLDVTLTERDDAGRTILVADLNLAPLSPGDYVLEVAVASGAENQRRQVGIRVVR
jgi:VWFA-related protein